MLQGVQADSLPWWTSQIMAQKPVLLETLGQLPEHAYAEYEILARQNIKSLLVSSKHMSISLCVPVFTISSRYSSLGAASLEKDEAVLPINVDAGFPRKY